MEIVPGGDGSQRGPVEATGPGVQLRVSFCADHARIVQYGPPHEV